MRYRAVVLAASAVALGLAACVPPTGPGDPKLPGNCVKTGATVRCTFAYNGKDGTDGTPQSFAVPAGVHSVTIDAYGAQGGGGGGLGGHARGTLPVVDGTVLHIYVGGTPTGTIGGYNGGGNGSPAGGGGSDVRWAGETLAERRIIAGGGGGAGLLTAAGFPDTPLAGGAGGGADGGDAECTVPNAALTDGICGTGGTFTVAGQQGIANCHETFMTAVTEATAGTFGAGGNGGSVTCTLLPEHDSVTATGAGGGGGFFGGGGATAGATVDPVAATVYGAGGGGSGAVITGATSPLNEAGVQTGNGSVFISYTP